MKFCCLCFYLAIEVGNILNLLKYMMLCLVEHLIAV
jgi:hypothetical protein